MLPPHRGPATTCTRNRQMIDLLLFSLSYKPRLRDQDSNLDDTG
jgi:hypothetical protein